jgi:hypothetical protein
VRRCFQLVVLVLIGALFASAQCNASCLMAACGPSVAEKASPCHHSRDKAPAKTACPYQQSQIFSPEAGPDLAQHAQTHALQTPPQFVAPQAIGLPSIRELAVTFGPYLLANSRAVVCLPVLRI